MLFKMFGLGIRSDIFSVRTRMQTKYEILGKWAIPLFCWETVFAKSSELLLDSCPTVWKFLSDRKEKCRTNFTGFCFVVILVSSYPVNTANLMKNMQEYVQSSSIKDQVTQNYRQGIFLDYFFVGHTVRQTDKIRRTFLKFCGFVRQTGGFRED